MKRSIETPTKITRRTKIETKFSNDVAVLSPARRKPTRTSSLLLNESVDVSPISSPSKRGRSRSLNLTEDADDKVANDGIHWHKITLLDTCVPEEDTNDLPSELDEESSRTKSPKNLNQDQNEEIKFCPAYSYCKQETKENEKPIAFGYFSEPNFTVSQFDDESNQRKLRSQKSDSKLKYEEDDHSNKLSVSNQSADQLEIKTYEKICERLNIIIDSDSDDEETKFPDDYEEGAKEFSKFNKRTRCEFICFEAEEVIGCHSGESLDSEERDESIESQDTDDGHADYEKHANDEEEPIIISDDEETKFSNDGDDNGSQDTNDEQHADDEEEPDDEMRDFIVTDEDEPKSSDDYEYDGDTDDSDSDTDDSGGDDGDECESPIDNKKRYLRIIKPSSSEEDDNEPRENNVNVVIDNKSNKETNEEIEHDKDSVEKEDEQQDLNNSSGTVVANVPVTAPYETITFSKFVSKENVEICEKQKEMNLLSKSTSVIEDSIKGDNSSQKQTRHSLPAESKTFMNSPNRGMKSPEKEITETIVEEETVKGLNENPGSEQLNESFSSERRTSDDKSLETANSSYKVVNEDFETVI